MPVVWIDEAVVFALHEEHLAEHGCAIGIRDRGLLESALQIILLSTATSGRHSQSLNFSLF